MSDLLVQVQNVSKKFCRSLKHSMFYGVQDICDDLIGRSAADRDLRANEFWAVNDVSFELRRGECLGLIGHNGAGKTTLLKMLNGLVKPDRGQITMKGRVGALIALGAGFNPILTGRENIYVNAAVLGLSKKETDTRLEEIIAFAELADFIDAPVQTYSSGMKVRLGFAIASAVEPDVLLLDEVLAVGDISFVIKCLNRMRDIASRCAVIFVSHNMNLVSAFCTRALVLDRGQQRIQTETLGDAFDAYYAGIPVERRSSGNGRAQIRALRLVGPSGDQTILQGAAAELQLELILQEVGSYVELTVFLMDEASNPIVCYPVHAEEPASFSAGTHRLTIPLGPLDLAGGNYSFTVAAVDPQTKQVYCREQGLSPFRVRADALWWGRVVRPVTALQRTGS